MPGVWGCCGPTWRPQTPSSRASPQYWPIGRCSKGNARRKYAETPSTRFCRIYRKQGTRRFESICKREWVQPATSSHSPKRYPFGGVKCSTLEFIATYGSLWQRQRFLLSRAAPTPLPANPLPQPRKPIRQNLAQQQTKHRSRPRWSRCRKARRSARR